jgi:hypothetical protein
MPYLIKKELTANIKYVLMGLAFFILYAFIFASNKNGLFMLCFIIFFYSLSATNLVLDERYKIQLLLTTLPIRRKDAVLSKYLLIPILFVVSFILYTLIFFGSEALGYGRIPVLDFQSAMMGLFAVSVFNAVMLPLCYKFGAESTRYVSFVIFFVFFFLSSLLGESDLSHTLDFFSRLSDVQTGLLLLGGTVVVNVVSYLFTYPIYEKKDL